MYETYRELMCHFYICLDLYPSRGNVNSLKTWVEYLFSVVDGPLKALQTLVEDKRIAKAMKAGGVKMSSCRRTTVNTNKGMLS